MTDDRAAYLRGEPLDDAAATREVGFIAREARWLIGVPIGSEDVDRTAEFYDRKARLLRYIGEPDLAGRAESQAAAYRPGGAYYRPLKLDEPDPANGSTCGCGHPLGKHLSAHSRGGCIECDCAVARPSWA